MGKTAAMPLRHALRSRRASRAFQVAAGPGAGLRLTGMYASGDYASGGNEVPVQRAILEALPPGGVFYDVGANVGYFSMLAARAVGPSGHVYAFEPVPWISDRIGVHCRLNGFANVRTLPVAVADAYGTSRLRVTAHPGGATLEGHGQPSDGLEWLDVPTVSVDGVIRAAGLRRPDVVKIDVEGAELAVLRGMRSCLAKYGPVVVFEIDGETNEEVHGKHEPIAALLDDAGYRVRPLDASYAGSCHIVRHFAARPVAAER
ncbi:MAG: FkbM family methyltransferase [Dehalococcoidia bacterium]|nr:FkbM family methyltransferase [Dehalococcoidia bacterium]